MMKNAAWLKKTLGVTAWFALAAGSFMGADRSAGQARRAARCNASGKCRNAPGGPIRPTEGRAILPAGRVARRLLCWAQPRDARLTGGQNRAGERGQYFRPLVLDPRAAHAPVSEMGRVETILATLVVLESPRTPTTIHL